MSAVSRYLSLHDSSPLEGGGWAGVVILSHFSCLFLLFTPPVNREAIYLLSGCWWDRSQGDSLDKKLWGCEPGLLHFNRKIFVAGRVVKWEEKWEVRECKYFSRQHWDLWEGMIFRTGPGDTPAVRGRRCPCQMSQTEGNILKSILFSILWVFILEWLRQRIKIYYI